MDLDFKHIELVGLNCPNFTGVKDHKQEAIFDLDSKTSDYFQAYSDRDSLHIHQDGAMYITEMNYNYANEEYEEVVVLDLTNNAEFKASMDKWLKENPLYRSHQFPYSVSTERDFWGCDKICDSLDSLLDYLKKYVGGKDGI